MLTGRLSHWYSALIPATRSKTRPLEDSIMKKIKSPYYGIVWIVIWTVALLWFLNSGMFNLRESIGLILVWLIFVGTTVYLLVRHIRSQPRPKAKQPEPVEVTPSLNAPCPCGSGKKYKRCCGAKAT